MVHGTERKFKRAEKLAASGGRETNGGCESLNQTGRFFFQGRIGCDMAKAKEIEQGNGIAGGNRTVIEYFASDKKRFAVGGSKKIRRRMCLRNGRSSAD